MITDKFAGHTPGPLEIKRVLRPGEYGATQPSPIFGANGMKEIPMLFSAPMVRALLEGRKTQTRRLKFTGKVGDVIWVRETWAVNHEFDKTKPRDIPPGAPVYYDADGGVVGKRVSIFMPRWASRIQLRVTAVRQEPLQSISESDALAEGVNPSSASSIAAALENCVCVDAKRPAGLAFRDLWRAIHGAESWAANPTVKVIEFERAES